MRSRATLLAGVLAVASAAPVLAQSATPDPELRYRREVFEYRRAGRSDPFRSLARAADLGVRVEDLSLLGVLYEPTGGSVAVVSRGEKTAPLRLRLGQSVGGVRIVAIRPRSVDVLVEDFGIARRETIELRSTEKKGER